MDSIIVYRNPIEKAMWEGGLMLPLMAFVLVMGVTFFITYKLLEKFSGKPMWKAPEWFLYVSSFVGVTCGSLAFIWLY